MANLDNYRFTSSHEWCRIEGDLATIGITQHAVEQLTDIVYVDLPAAGRELKAGQAFGEIESVKAVSELLSPLSGAVESANTAAAGDPASISADPYGAGWLIKIKIANREELPGLLDKAAYDKMVAAS